MKTTKEMKRYLDKNRDDIEHRMKRIIPKKKKFKLRPFLTRLPVTLGREHGVWYND